MFLKNYFNCGHFCARKILDRIINGAALVEERVKERWRKRREGEDRQQRGEGEGRERTGEGRGEGRDEGRGGERRKPFNAPGVLHTWSRSLRTLICH